MLKPQLSSIFSPKSKTDIVNLVVLYHIDQAEKYKRLIPIRQRRHDEYLGMLFSYVHFEIKLNFNFFKIRWKYFCYSHIAKN